MLAAEKMRYQVDWPTPCVYLYSHRQIHVKTHGKPWRTITAGRSPEMVLLMKYLARLSRFAHPSRNMGKISVLAAPIPAPPHRDQNYLSSHPIDIQAFSITPAAKSVRHYVKRINLFLDRKSGLLRAVDVIARRGSIEYWFFATHLNVQFPAALFAPKGKS